MLQPAPFWSFCRKGQEEGCSVLCQPSSIGTVCHKMLVTPSGSTRYLLPPKQAHPALNLQLRNPGIIFSVSKVQQALPQT